MLANKPYVIGLTGGIGCGKTEASQYLESLGAAHLDADVISRSLTAENGEALGEIRRVFGDGVFREDGVLVAIRTKNTASYVSDMTMDALQRIEPLHDELHKAPPGSKVLDVDVYINFDQLKRLRDNDTVYNQLLKIHRDHMYYYNEILRLYSEFVEHGENISDEFNTLVLRCMELSNNRKYVKRSLKLCDLREPIEFITFSITYAYEREISVGSKLTDRCGVTFG